VPFTLECGELALVGHAAGDRERLAADEAADRLEQRRTRLLDGIDDVTGNDPARAGETDWDMEIDDLARRIGDGEIERACAVEVENPGEVAGGIEGERLAVEGDFPT